MLPNLFCVQYWALSSREKRSNSHIFTAYIQSVQELYSNYFRIKIHNALFKVSLKLALPIFLAFLDPSIISRKVNLLCQNVWHLFRSPYALLVKPDFEEVHKPSLCGIDTQFWSVLLKSVA